MKKQYIYPTTEIARLDNGTDLLNALGPSGDVHSKGVVEQSQSTNRAPGRTLYL